MTRTTRARVRMRRIRNKTKVQVRVRVWGNAERYPYKCTPLQLQRVSSNSALEITWLDISNSYREHQSCAPASTRCRVRFARNQPHWNVESPKSMAILSRTADAFVMHDAVVTGGTGRQSRTPLQLDVACRSRTGSSALTLLLHQGPR